MTGDNAMMSPVRDPALAGLSREAAARRRSSPRVRRLAAARGVTLDAVAGTGFGGRVRPEDLEGYLAGRAGAAGLAGESLAPTPAAAAAPLLASRRDATATMVFEVDATASAHLRAQQGAAFRRRFGAELGELTLLVWGAAAALAAVPELNVSWVEGKREVRRACHVGVALRLGGEPGGGTLVIPVLRDADRLSFVGIARALDELVRRAGAGDLASGELGDAALTVDQVSTPEAVFTTPLLPPAQAALLTTSASERQLVVVTDADGTDSIAVRSVLRASLAYDTRAIDATIAARFLTSFRRAIEAARASTGLGSMEHGSL